MMPPKSNRLGAGATAALLAGALAGCAPHSESRAPVPRPDVAPSSQAASGPTLSLSAANIQPMYREVLAIDLDATYHTAAARNFDIQSARWQVEASRGAWESAIGSLAPAVGISAPFEHVSGSVRAVQGNIVGAAFNTFQLYGAVQWITNPGSVIYQLLAARKRLNAAEHEEAAVAVETLRNAGVQYYALTLAQVRVATTRQAVHEADEFLRVARLRAAAGIGLPADELRAEARLAEFQGNLVRAVDEFYRASMALALTLRLDATVTLVPRGEELAQVTLVRPELELDDLLEVAISYRPDLQRVRALAEQAAALRGAAWWGDFGPQFTLGYQFGGITGHADNVIAGKGLPNNLIINPGTASGAFSTNPIANGVTKEAISQASARLAHTQDQTSGFNRQERFTAGVGWRFTAAAFGELRTARAVAEQALIEAQRQYEAARAQVAGAVQATKTQAELVRLTEQQVAAAEEALRLTQANFEAGTMTTLEVLESQDAANQARLRRADAIVSYNQAQINMLAALGLNDPKSNNFECPPSAR